MAKFKNYLDTIISTSHKYLSKSLSTKEYEQLNNQLARVKTLESTEAYVSKFLELYTSLIKKKHQKEYKESDKSLRKFLDSKTSNLKIIWGDCLDALKKMDNESIDLMVTSPPYYNARDYSQWANIDDYLQDMREIIRETFRVLDNHKVWVFNVGDIFANPKTKTKSVWGKQRIPLGAYFIKIFEEEGFTFVDDYIWDKGEVQSQRQKNAGKPYPYYQYPLNCYEHILIFHKHRLDLTRFPCPRCGSLQVSGNTQNEPGLQSWECKNNDCFERSKSNRGKRFSLKTNFTQSHENRVENNEIDTHIINKWRRDILKFSPVIKINSKGENRIGHTAPFPEDIPEMAIQYFSYEGDKVLDPFAGSFTSAIVATKNKRIGIGIELNKDFRKPILTNIKRSDDLPGLNVSLKPEEFSIKNRKKINRQL